MKRRTIEPPEPVFELEGSTKGPKLPRTATERETHKRLIVVLEGATLETIKVGERFELLNADDHAHLLAKHERDTSDARPDITHQCLLMLLDSPLNKAGRLQIFVHTKKNVLFEVDPQTRLPRTFKRFAGLMVQLLRELSVRASNGSATLLRVVKNPVTDHLPTGCLKLCCSLHAQHTVDLAEFACRAAAVDQKPIVFVIGAFAKGSVDVDYVEKTLCVSHYPLSAALVCAKLMDAYERAWGIF